MHNQAMRPKIHQTNIKLHGDHGDHEHEKVSFKQKWQKMREGHGHVAHHKDGKSRFNKEDSQNFKKFVKSVSEHHDHPKVKHFAEKKSKAFMPVILKNNHVCDDHENYKADFDFNALDGK